MVDQSSLGGRKVNRLPRFNQYTIARVTSVKDYQKFGRIEVIFLDFGSPCPVWVIGDLDREPVEGDQVLVGFIEGRQDAPYLAGFLKNKSYTTNFISVQKDKIRVQLPVFEIGQKDGIAQKDVEGHLLDDKNQPLRAFIELSEESVVISFPTSKNGSTPPTTITLKGDALEIDHPGTIKLNGGTKGVARVGDQIEVVVDGVPYLGVIKGGSDSILVD